ncbi:hypothetical protein QTL97_10290 [Sporosarcina thermotolerans]|uniref:Uncharacterized protein n=1 Tax=Sporosarcina thermotolerans TaxID=633404 RepID=A0AAW9ABE5_9BACL|nr:hypothetical protein [Sporosarcina thermotolerans]MDW0117325.1 hypothetical protein [Sporosarcina thermotolerans]WHT47476.1 hypothetical protein QNH10_15030 [Sporosarcina thermotolerans]
MSRTMVWTTLFAALFTLISLKSLHFFNFIKWSPVGWAEKWLIFGSKHEAPKWALLFVILLIAFGIFYLVSKLTVSISPAITAIVISVICAVALEWVIFSPTSLSEGVKSISIPFLSIIAVVSRFVTGTAVYEVKSSNND